MAAISMESSSKHCSEDTEERERAIAELKNRIRVLENELPLKHGRAEESLQLMRYILDQARDEASLAGPDGRFYYVSDAKCRSLGYTREELLSMHVWDVEPDMTGEKWASVWRDIRDHGFKTFETWHRTKHGRIFQTAVSATYFDFHGREYLCAFVRDITERKRAEEALADAKAQAELYVDLMGHDINNFNQTARGYLELMDGMVEDEKLKEFVAKPLKDIDCSSRLIRNVQKLQRARSGEPRVEVLDLGLLVEEVARQFKSMPGDKSVDIACDVIRGINVQANELLRDVFINLIGNAIKHSPWEASIDIRVAPEERDGRGYCRVTIDDNGPGVPDDMKEKVFDRLKRGDTKAKGSGLGLYLVKLLVESYGGRVWVEDRTKGDRMRGARFVVVLPTVEN